jgi:hypothetical protein
MVDLWGTNFPSDDAFDDAQWQSSLMNISNELVVAGYAKVPETSASRGTGDLLSVVLRIDPESHIVLAADSTARTELVRKWLQDMVVGIDFSKPVGDLLDRIERLYLGNASGSIRQAVQDAWRKYATFRGQHHEGEPSDDVWAPGDSTGEHDRGARTGLSPGGGRRPHPCRRGVS